MEWKVTGTVTIEENDKDTFDELIANAIADLRERQGLGIRELQCSTRNGNFVCFIIIAENLPYR
jgi:hypothetical protein